MVRSVSEGVYTALQARALVARDFIWFVVRDRTTGAPVVDGEWSDVGSITCDVIDPDTGGTQARQFFGSGTLISISDIPLVSTVTVQTVTVTLSQVHDRVQDLVRTYECKQGTVQIFRGMFDPDTRALVGSAVPRFVGFIDHIEIKTPEEGGDGSVTLNCTSHTQEMTRSNPDTRSDASQRLRSSSDNFFQDAAKVSEWVHFWGRKSETISTLEDARTAAIKARFG